jgi:hypothetical protein
MKKSEKNLDMFKGGEKIRQAAAIFIDIYYLFVVSNICLSLKMILFESFDI